MGRTTQRLGKRGEYAVIGKLLEMGCDVYTPIVDVERIDCVIRSERGEYKEIQVKTRTPSHEQGARVFEVQGLTVRKNYFVILHLINSSDYWVLPSVIFAKHGRTNHKTGATRIVLTDTKQFRLRRYRDNFDLLKK